MKESVVRNILQLHTLGIYNKVKICVITESEFFQQNLSEEKEQVLFPYSHI